MGISFVLAPWFTERPPWDQVREIVIFVVRGALYVPSYVHRSVVSGFLVSVAERNISLAIENGYCDS